MYFFVTKFLLQPYPFLILLTAATVARLWYRQTGERRRLIPVTLALISLVAASTPALIYPLVGTLEWGYPPLPGRPAATQAIVVLAGGIKEPDRTRLAAELTDDTLVRCLHAAELYHRGAPLPVVVTGGVLDPKSGIPPVAPVMRDLLVRLGVRESDVLVEPLAQTTAESATLTREILARRGLSRVTLVTEAIHMRRSLTTFRRNGVDAVPAACGHTATEFKPKLDSFLPSARAVFDLSLVVHEWVGLAWYRARGKV